MEGDIPGADSAFVAEGPDTRMHSAEEELDFFQGLPVSIALSAGLWGLLAWVVHIVAW